MRFMGALLLICVLANTPSAKASPSDEDIALAVLGEARGETEEGKTALAEAIRNRGSLKGVYGFEAECNARAETKRAVLASRSSNLLGGADVWGTDSDIKKFQKTKWFKRYKFVARIGRHSFFKLRNVK